MIYDISHRTTFRYSAKVSISQHLTHLAPRSHPQQTLLKHHLSVVPAPTVMRHDIDYFGNPTTYLTVEEPHAELVVDALSTVDVSRPEMPAADRTAPWDSIIPALSQAHDPESLAAYQFVFESPFTGSAKAADYAQESFTPGRPILEAATDLMGRIFNDFKYEGGVTDVYTPVDTVIDDRRGVCQDFAHLQIACMRGLGLPARYVSGYLLTYPPPGQEKLVGSDASHAWLAVWVPDHGWVDLDPTNNMIPGIEHITVAWGRDYGDVSPINGLVLGGGKHAIDVSVDVRQVGDPDSAPTDPAGAD